MAKSVSITVNVPIRHNLTKNRPSDQAWIIIKIINLQNKSDHRDNHRIFFFNIVFIHNLLHITHYIAVFFFENGKALHERKSKLIPMLNKFISKQSILCYSEHSIYSHSESSISSQLFSSGILTHLQENEGETC